MFEFQNLEVYKKAKTLHLSCKKMIKANNFDRYVNDQLARASFSVSLNIAEGSAKFSKADRKNYFVTARGSVFECIAVADIMKDEKLISEKEFKNLYFQGDELSRMLFSMIKNLESK